MLKLFLYMFINVINCLHTFLIVQIGRDVREVERRASVGGRSISCDSCTTYQLHRIDGGPKKEILHETKNEEMKYFYICSIFLYVVSLCI